MRTSSRTRGALNGWAHQRPSWRHVSKALARSRLSQAVVGAGCTGRPYIDSAAGTKGLIIDIRNYPSEFVVFALGSHLVERPSPFARFTTGDLEPVTKPNRHWFGAFWRNGQHCATRTKPLARRPTGSRVIRSRIGCVVTGGVCDQATAMPARRVGASRLRRVRPSAATSRSLRRFASTPVRASIGSRPPSSDATTCFSSRSAGSPIGTVVTQICALRFFCRYVLKRRDVREDLPYPKQRLRLPVVLSPDEVQRLIAGAKNLYHRTLLLTLYGAGLAAQRSVPAQSPRHR